MGRLSIRRVLMLALPAALVAVLYLMFGRLGFQPTDDGNLLAQTYRLLHGELPHRDVIFARPMGSATLHVVDYALPMGLFEASRLIGIAEFVAYSLLLSWIVFDLAPSGWGPTRWLAAGASVLVNMHVFPLMGWYTTDGLLLTALGFVLLRVGMHDDRAWVRRAGLLALGCAPLAKQSFYLTPLFGLAWVALDRPPAKRRIRRMVEAIAVSSVPLAVYLALVVSGGALDEFVNQILGAKAVWGRSFIATFDQRSAIVGLAIVLVATGALLSINRLAARRPAFALAALATRAAYTGLIVWFVVSRHLAYRATWALSLLWAALLVLVWRTVVERAFDRVGLLVVTLGWMTSLSWGYEVPNLVGGTTALYLLDRAWRGARMPENRRPAMAAGLALALIMTGFVSAAFAQARYRNPYGDRPAAELTATLADVSPEFGGIRTNPNTRAYLSSLADCLRRHPARWTAVLPDNPAIYPALKLRNPFPIDWMYFAEIAGHEDRLLAAARRLSRAGNYLVLFQTFKLTALQQSDPLPVATVTSPIYGGRVISGIRDRLRGSPVVCGYFTGVYARG